jgi:uncharacterized sodium:solute symporter family permease YidK
LAVEVNVLAWLVGGLIALCGAALVLLTVARLGSLGQASFPEFRKLGKEFDKRHGLGN